MASNVNQIISKFRRAFPQVDEVRAKGIFDDAHREIMERCRLREITIQVSLTAGTRLYDLTEFALKILSVDYLISATSVRPLHATSVEEMDITSAGWRVKTDRSVPTSYFLIGKDTGNTSKQQIGFDPIPVTTTSAGYPIVNVYAIREAILSYTNTVDPRLRSDQVYVSCMGEQACREIPELREQWSYWDGLKTRDLDDNMEFVKNRQDKNPTRFILGTRSNRVI